PRITAAPEIAPTGYRLPRQPTVVARDEWRANNVPAKPRAGGLRRAIKRAHAAWPARCSARGATAHYAFGTVSHQRAPKRPCRNATKAWTLPGTSLGEG